MYAVINLPENYIFKLSGREVEFNGQKKFNLSFNRFRNGSRDEPARYLNVTFENEDQAVNFLDTLVCYIDEILDKKERSIVLPKRSEL